MRICVTRLPRTIGTKEIHQDFCMRYIPTVFLATLAILVQSQIAFSQHPISKGVWTFKNDKPESVTFDYGTELTAKEVDRLSSCTSLSRIVMGVEEELRTPENEPHHHPGANGHANGDGANGNGQHSNGRPATQSQVRAIYASSRLLGCSMRKPKPLCFQGFRHSLTKKGTGCHSRCPVEAAGIEPASRGVSMAASTCVVDDLNFATRASNDRISA